MEDRPHMEIVLVPVEIHLGDLHLHGIATLAPNQSQHACILVRGAGALISINMQRGQRILRTTKYRKLPRHRSSNRRT